jgi:hypothetical protein
MSVRDTIDAETAERLPGRPTEVARMTLDVIGLRLQYSNVIRKCIQRHLCGRPRGLKTPSVCHPRKLSVLLSSRWGIPPHTAATLARDVRGGSSPLGSVFSGPPRGGRSRHPRSRVPPHPVRRRLPDSTEPGLGHRVAGTQPRDGRVAVFIDLVVPGLDVEGDKLAVVVPRQPRSPGMRPTGRLGPPAAE